MITLLADSTVAAGPMIPGEWLTGIVVAVIGAIGGIWLKRSGVEQGRSERSVTIDGQPIAFTQGSPPATQNELAVLKRDIDARLNKIETSLCDERAGSKLELGKIHARLDTATVATAELKGNLQQISDNVSRLLELAMHHKPSAR